MAERFDGFVLTGGKSVRMGTDKALLEIEGEAMAARVAHALTTAGATRVVCIGGDLAALRSLGLIAEEDGREGSGPLGGVLAALERARERIALIAPCDLLAPTARAMQRLRDSLEGRDDAMVAVPLVDGRWRPLPCAVRTASRSSIEAAFATGERAVHGALARLARVEVDVGPLDDADTPEDLSGRQ